MNVLNSEPEDRLINEETDATVELTDDEKIDFVAARILREYRRAYLSIIC